MEFSYDFEDLVSFLAKGQEPGPVDARGAIRVKLEERTRRKLESDYANLGAAFDAQTVQIAELQRTNVILAVEVLRSRRAGRVAKDTAREARAALAGDTADARTLGAAFVAGLRAQSPCLKKKKH
jgi:hypothetical protein